MFWLGKLPKEVVFMIIYQCDVKSVINCGKALKIKSKFWEAFAKQYSVKKVAKTWQSSVRVYRYLYAMNFAVPWYSHISGFQSAIDTLEIVEEQGPIEKFYDYYRDLPNLKKGDGWLRTPRGNIAHYGDIQLHYDTVEISFMKIPGHMMFPKINTSFSIPWSVDYISTNYCMNKIISSKKKGSPITIEDILFATQTREKCLRKVQYIVERENQSFLHLQIVERRLLK